MSWGNSALEEMDKSIKDICIRLLQSVVILRRMVVIIVVTIPYAALV